MGRFKFDASRFHIGRYGNDEAKIFEGVVARGQRRPGNQNNIKNNNKR
jgi:hypothetical protein